MTTSHRACPCFQPCAKQLWFCYEIGLGIDRSEQAATKWRSQCADDRMWDPQEYMRLVNDKYDDVEKTSREDRLSHLIGYQTASPTVFMIKYRESRRLEEAEAVCRRELEARKQSMGPQSRAYLSQLMALSAILLEVGSSEESLQAADEAALTYLKVYGSDDIGTLGAMNYYATVLFEHGAFREAEKVQVEFLGFKRSAFGNKHRTNQTSSIMLAAIYYFQGRFEESLSEARRLFDEQVSHLEETHADMLNTRLWICQARLVLGDNVHGLLGDMRQLSHDYESVAPPDDDGVLLAKELLSRVLLALAKPEPRSPVIEDFVDESLQILVDDVLDRVEDPGGVYATGAHVLKGVNFSLLLVAYTTFICGLGFKLDFTTIHESIPVITSDEFVSSFPKGHLDMARLDKVLPLIEELENLAHVSITEGTEVDRILWELSHRWLL